MTSLTTEDVAVPGDILCMVLGQNVENVDSDRQKWNKQTTLTILGTIVLL